MYVSMKINTRNFGRMLLKRGMGNGEWGMVVSGNTKKISWSLRSTAKRRGLHVVSERWKGRIFICPFFPSFWNY